MARHWLQTTIAKWFRYNPVRRQTRGRRPRTPLLVESLEKRELMDAAFGSILMDGDRLHLFGSPQSDTGDIRIVDDQIEARFNNVLQHVPLNQIDQIVFHDMQANDILNNYTTLAVFHANSSTAGDVSSFHRLTKNGELQREVFDWETVDTGVTKLATVANGWLFHLKGSYVMWGDVSYWGGVRNIDIAPDGTIHLLGTNGILQRLVNGSWENVWNGVEEFAFHADGTEYVRWSDGTTRNSPPSSAKTIFSADGLEYHLNDQNQVIHNGIIYWANVRDIAFDHNNVLHLLRTDGTLQRLQKHWKTYDTNVVKAFALRDNSTLYLRESGEVWYQKGNDAPYIMWGKYVSDLHVTANGTIYLLRNKELAKLQRDQSQWHSLADDVKKFFVQPGDDVYYLRENGEVWRKRGDDGAYSVWGNFVTDFHMMADGTTYLLRNSELSVQHPGDAWMSLATDVSKFFVHAGNDVYYLRENGEVWRKRGNKDAYAVWGNFVTDLHMAADGTTYLLRNHDLSVQHPGGDWVSLATDVSKFYVLPGEDVYYLRHNGEVWRKPNGNDAYAVWGNFVADLHMAADGTTYLLRNHDLSVQHPGGPWTSLAGAVSKFFVDTGGIVYWLRRTNHLDRLTPDGKVETMDKVRDFRVQDHQLQIQRNDYSWETTYFTNLPAVMQNSVRQPSTHPENNSDGIHPILGTTETENSLNKSYKNSNGQEVARTLLDSVGRVSTPFGMGSGTLLELGGNQWVLTADHVIERVTNFGQVTFTVYSASGTAPRTFTVTNIIRRGQFGGRDLALLQLAAPVTGIQGAVLPDFSAADLGMQVLQVGYGINNSGHSGTRNFGYSKVDEFEDSITVSTGTTYAGPFLTYRYDAGEAATAPGDSGGPDFVPIRSIDTNGNVVWIPAVVGVHNSGQHSVDVNGDNVPDVPAIGDRTSSTSITANVAAVIRGIIPAAPAPTLVLEQIRVFNDGDGNVSGGGEWHFTLELNGLPYTFDRNFCDGTHTLGLQFNVAWTDQLDIAFYGLERDDGFFTGGDDAIGRWGTQIQIPTRNLGMRQWFESTIVTGDTAYQLVFSIGW